MVVGLAMLLFLATLTLTLQERAGQIGLIAAVGGARRTIVALYSAELLVVVAVPSMIAAGATTWGLRIAEERLLGALPTLSFVPESLLWLPGWLPLGVTGAMVAVVAVCCGPQLIAAARRGPLAALQHAAP
jgi:ABC-type antimicrobial peptide transport system permease subunit